MMRTREHSSDQSRSDSVLACIARVSGGRYGQHTSTPSPRPTPRPQMSHSIRSPRTSRPHCSAIVFGRSKHSDHATKRRDLCPRPFRQDRQGHAPRYRPARQRPTSFWPARVLKRDVKNPLCHPTSTVSALFWGLVCVRVPVHRVRGNQLGTTSRGHPNAARTGSV